MSKKSHPQFLHKMFNVSALLLASKSVTPLPSGAINQTLRQFAPLSDNGFFLAD